MTILTLEHTTTYRYKRPVKFGEHRMMFRPRDSHDLRLHDTKLTMSPPSHINWHHDIFGNSIAVASFDRPAKELFIESQIKVEPFAQHQQDFVIEPHARALPFAYSTDEVPDLGRTRERHYPDTDHLIDAWAGQFVQKSNGNGHVDVMDMLVKMTRAIQSDFKYQRRYAEGTQTPVRTLKLRTGSCRDYALLMMEAVRTFGLAARFVSGYLYDSSIAGGAKKGTTVGAGETHAWLQIYLPGAGWVEFDPTNGAVGGANLIRVAVARDPRQAVPLSGTFVGCPGDFIEMSVAVEVTAE
ncbi:MAG: transglutaminase family protein [Proteobacteria bacterium]|nr:transglutaminase family protein [Pseudomonadota bacterium]